MQFTCNGKPTLEHSLRTLLPLSRYLIPNSSLRSRLPAHIQNRILTLGRVQIDIGRYSKVDVRLRIVRDSLLGCGIRAISHLENRSQRV